MPVWRETIFIRRGEAGLGEVESQQHPGNDEGTSFRLA